METDRDKQKHIVLVLSALNAGGAERVMSELAHFFNAKKNIKVSMVLMTKAEKFFELPPEVTIYEPNRAFNSSSRLSSTWNSFSFTRKKLKELKPDAVLSFSGKYNSFVLLAGLGLGLRIFVSDRSRPTISYGRLLDFLNPRLYRRAEGIIAQTQTAKDIAIQKTGHKNIKVIGNPIRDIKGGEVPREKIILNVGRFIRSKHQDWLVDYFNQLNLEDWKLVFLGDGTEFKKVEEYASKSPQAENIIFAGSVKNVDEYYRKASIFAFTTSSEGFPNALGEAMKAGMAVICFDCLAGPSDLIDHNENGMLVPVGDHNRFKAAITELCNSKKLREQFGSAAEAKIKSYYQPDYIGQEYLDFLIPKT